MTHEKIIKRPNGRQYKITVNIICSPSTVNYRFDVYYREKGGKKWHDLPNSLYDHEIRQMSLEKRNQHRVTNYLRFVSEKEIQSALTEAWVKIEPRFEHNPCECTGCYKAQKYENENDGYFDRRKYKPI